MEISDLEREQTSQNIKSISLELVSINYLAYSTDTNDMRSKLIISVINWH